MARGFAEQGATVILMARRVRLESLEKEIKDAGGEALAIGLDVTDDAQIDASIDKILEAYGKVDVLLKRSRWQQGGAITEMTNEAWDFYELDLTSI